MYNTLSLSVFIIKEAKMLEITTDPEVLCQKSDPIDDLEIGDIVQQLSITIPDNALGLAAPQIGIHKRIFLANLSSGLYAFINPQLTWKTLDKVPSEEACLSLPGICRCVERYARVEISCFKRLDMTTGDLVINPEPMRLKDRDSFIIQHENDHLNGVLITQLPTTMTSEARRQRKEEARNERIEKARLNKKKQTALFKPPKLSVKNQAKKKREAEKIKKQQRTARRQEKIRVEIREKYTAEKEGLFSKNISPVLDAETQDQPD